ncbi:MAG: enoyl-CoA hydratase [Burkholderiaceae bacterium]|nr:enoyl-CoA hydratase [Burkholderiaceae bacterium]
MNAPEQPFVLREDHDGVATVTMNRGDRFNPLSVGMIVALLETFDAIAKDSSVRVVVLTGNGRGFCAGHDLKEMRDQAENEDWLNTLFNTCSDLMIKITQMPQPVIAKVHGIATAAGCQLTSMCDLAVVADDSRFALPGVNIGLFCSTPAVGVARNIGRKRAMEMLLTGELVDARTAMDWGLVNRVVPRAQLDAEVARLAAVIKSKSAPVIAMGKKTFYQQIEMGLSSAYSVSGQAMTCNMGFEDTSEGIDAFLGKREPRWKDR